jgi:phosphatidate cytidylyltransferase
LSNTGAGVPNDLPARIVSSVTLAAIAVGGAVLGGWTTALVLAVVTVIFHHEWISLTDRSPRQAFVFTGCLILALALIVFGYVLPGLAVVALAIGASALAGGLWRPVGIVYVAMLGVGLLVLRLAPEGLAAVLVVLFTVSATDTGAYFAGRAIGGPKLAPRVSPNKTWAGAIGGLVSGIVVALVVAAAMHVRISAPLALVVALLSIASQAGDLFESWVKRTFGAKDSGTIIPGHGGLMDRVDGLAVASGVAVIIGWLHGGADPAAGLLLW